ncbi:sodium-coupled monocarboxylate transporter 1-like isoform X2 [Ptychodera flava]|uniref:sodium-coupled monocarboxylate transporter 1-like isoform X2 n=1 Tax=Ptychodera flava TaxID=63121 RepID=UPI00396A3FE0
MSSSDYSLWPLDIVVFVAILLFVAAQGIYHGWKKQRSTEEYLTANRSMSGLPVAMSLLVSFTSAVALLGTPAEIYIYGLGYAAYLFCFLWVYPLVAYLYVPVFQPLRLTSAYEYFEWRFDNYTLRVLISGLFIFQTVFYMAIAMIGPALAFEAVYGISLGISIFINGCICVFYTAVGGIKAVIWTDVFLFMIILIDLILIIVFGTIEAGGMSHVWEFNKADGRLAESLFYFPFDLTERVTFLGCTIGGGVNFAAIFLGQASVQRIISTKNMKQAKISVMLNLPFQWIFLPMTALCGLVIYAYYNNFLTRAEAAVNATLPPVLTFPLNDHGGVEPRYEPNYESSDQILIYFVSDQFGHIRGFMGLFMSCIFAGTLSTVSSSLNALIAVTLEDFVKPWRRWRSKRTKKPVYVNDRVDTIAGKLMTVAYGMLAIALSYLASYMESLITMGNTIFGTSGGPILGTFLLGFFWKRTTGLAAVLGALIGFAMGCWVAVGAVLYSDRLDEVLAIYSMSFLWYGTFSCVVTVVVTVLFSEIHRCVSKSEREKSKEVDAALLAGCLRPKDWKSKYVTDSKDDERNDSDDADDDEERHDKGCVSVFENFAFDDDNDDGAEGGTDTYTNNRHRNNIRIDATNGDILIHSKGTEGQILNETTQTSHF